MRRIWFLYKMIESMLGLCCLGYHSRGFLHVSYIQDHYMYVAIFGGFSLMSMFGCLSICLNEPISPMRDALLSILASIAFILVSMNSMYHAEKDFHLMYLSADIKTETKDEVDVDEEPHSFFKYSKAQSVAALICSCFYLLHAILAFDAAMMEIEEVTDYTDDESDISENDERLLFYVFGKKVHFWLNQFKWFSSLADVPKNNVRNEELIEVG